MKSLTVALIGVTGMVGRTMLKVLEQRKFPVEKLVPVASAKSIGTTIDFNGDSVEVVQGKVVMEAGDEIEVSANSATALDCVVSVLKNA